MNYMLRKTLIPWRMQETIDEVLAYCIANRVGEVMWKIDAEAFNKGFTSIEYIKEFLPALKKAKYLFDVHSIATSINPWMTLNHADYGRDSRKRFPDFKWIVDFTGKQSVSCACPLSAAWQEHITESYSLYASVSPAILWVEDDFRNFNHIPVIWGCFCNEHLEAFSKIIGRSITRDELVKCILTPGKPHPYRAEWMNFLGDTMIRIAAKISARVLSVSPNTSIGLMCSLPDDHSIEGRRWHELIAALCGAHKPICRPHYGAYRHEHMDDIYNAVDVVRQTAACLPTSTKICPEVENVPFTEFVKSVKYTQLQLSLSAAMSNADITMNLYDHVGTPLTPDDPYGIMLHRTYPFLDGLLKYCRPGGLARGIGMPFSPEIAKFARTCEGKEFSELHGKGNGWSTALQSMGFAVTFQDSPILAVTGQSLRGFSPDQVRQMLAKGVLLDASAARTLIEDGFGDLVGVDIECTMNKNDLPIAAEDLGNGKYISPRLATPDEIVARMLLKAGASAVSNFVDPEKVVLMPAMVTYENSLGGRVAVYAMDLSDGVLWFMNWQRKEQMRQVLSWLSRGQLPAFVSGGPHAVPLRFDYGDYTILAVANNSPDTWESISAELFLGSRPVKSVLSIEPDGSWRPAPLLGSKKSEGIFSFACDMKLDYLSLAAFCIQF
jgi:hypothetical protein